MIFFIRRLEEPRPPNPVPPPSPDSEILLHQPPPPSYRDSVPAPRAALPPGAVRPLAPAPGMAPAAANLGTPPPTYEEALEHQKFFISNSTPTPPNASPLENRKSAEDETQTETETE